MSLRSNNDKARKIPPKLCSKKRLLIRRIHTYRSLISFYIIKFSSSLSLILVLLSIYGYKSFSKINIVGTFYFLRVLTPPLSHIMWKKREEKFSLHFCRKEKRRESIQRNEKKGRRREYDSLKIKKKWKKLDWGREEGMWELFEQGRRVSLTAVKILLRE